MSTIEIIPIPILRDNYVWIVIHKESRQALIIDPGEAQAVIDYVEDNNLTPSAILITHHHWDHTNGLQGLVDRYDVPVFGSECSPNQLITHQVSGNNTVQINEFFPEYKVISIPGHTLDHVAYYAGDVLFCGDTLFAAGCGRVFEGTAEQLYSSLQALAALPSDTKIYCAHEYTLSNLRFAEAVEPNNSDIKMRIKKVKLMRDQHLPTLPSILSEEMLTNPFLRCHISSVMRSAEQQTGYALKNPVEVFSALREWKNNV